jgi:maltose/moltooligosaccharide transporter
MPYQMLASSIPSDKTGVYMGIFNMFIVIPMIIQIFSMQYFVYDFLGQNPINVIRLAGIFLMIGGVFSLFVRVKKQTT